MQVIVNHAHVFQEEVRADGTIQVLKNVMDQCSIDKAVCFAPFSTRFNSNGESANKWLSGQIKNDDRLLAFGAIDFSKDNLADQVEEIYQLGFSGIKLHPAFQKFKVDGEDACEVYRAAEEYGLPISFHTGIHWHRISSYNTLLYDEVAFRFPKLKICMEHAGGYAFFNEAIGVMCNNPRTVYAGLTSVFDREKNRFWYLGKEKVKDLIWLTGIDRSIFGLDFPFNSAVQIADAMRAMRECLEEMGLGRTEEEKIFGGNLLKMIERP